MIFRKYDFLARMMRLGNVSARIKKILMRLKKPVDELMAKIMRFIKNKIKGFGKKGKGKLFTYNWEHIVQIIQNIVPSVGKIARGMLGEVAFVDSKHTFKTSSRLPKYRPFGDARLATGVAHGTTSLFDAPGQIVE